LIGFESSIFENDIRRLWWIVRMWVLPIQSIEIKGFWSENMYILQGFHMIFVRIQKTGVRSNTYH
jgi:hypothetical protein